MKIQSEKKWFITGMTVLLGILTIIAFIMVTIDPFFHYHAPLKGFSYHLYEERYVNDGISRHFDYDTLIIGTSISQKFKTSEMDQLFGTKSVKEPFPGAGYQELSENLSRALKRNPNLKTVLWMIDSNGFLREYDWKRYENFPTYLYDDNPFNDVAYLFNKAVLYHGALVDMKLTLNGSKSTSMDEYSFIEQECGLNVILSAYDRSSKIRREDVNFTEEDYETVVKTIDTNIVRLVKQYPDVTFYIAYPPFSICYFDALHLEGMLEKQLQAEQLATELLLECDNVKLFSFFDQYDVICNPDNYYDEAHYGSWINSQILQWIAEGTGLVTKENYLDKLKAEREFFTYYDYDSIYEGCN